MVLSRAFFLLIAVGCSAFALSDAELDRIGRRVWQNECGGRRDGLTSWNAGEDFASLGIGHFIWYPKGKEGPFEESFPKLAEYLSKHGATVADWMKGDCPWNSKAEFQAEFNGARMNQLRDLLAGTVKQQSKFLAERMQQALPNMVAQAGGEGKRVKANFERLASTGKGTYALIDYVNFKGEGTKSTERYKGEGWGLLQVLAEMRPDASDAAAEFSRSAAAVLERRVKNSPPERGEARWLAGWKSRVRGYAE